jgi:hypothetical protein
MNIELHDLTVLIECKRLVESMILEKKYWLTRMDKSDAGYRAVQAQIDRMERALEGKPPLTFEDRFGKDLK